MYKELIFGSIDLLREAPFIFNNVEAQNVKRVVRGEFGKKNIPKAPACFIFPDFGVPGSLEDKYDNKNTCMELAVVIIGEGKRTQAEAEDACLDLTELVEARITDRSIDVIRLDGTHETNNWETESLEWLERKQTGCVIALTLKMELWK